MVNERRIGWNDLFGEERLQIDMLVTVFFKSNKHKQQPTQTNKHKQQPTQTNKHKQQPTQTNNNQHKQTNTNNQQHNSINHQAILSKMNPLQISLQR